MTKFFIIFDGVKQFLTVSLLILYINSNTELHEFLRLPLLFKHFDEHRQKSEDLSFLDFLIMHYKNDSSDDKDSRLPFKNPAHAFIASTLTLCSPNLVLREVSPLAEVLHSSIYKEAFIPSPLSKIFQPPRIY